MQAEFSESVRRVSHLGVPGLTAQSLIRAASRYVPIEGALLLRS